MTKALIAMSVLCMAATAFASGSGLSREDVAKVKRYYVNNGVGDGDSNTINPDQLKGAAKTEYERLSNGRECKRDGYCPEAYSINAYGTETLAVSRQDDGGMVLYVYTKAGKQIISCSQSESGEMDCGE